MTKHSIPMLDGILVVCPGCRYLLEHGLPVNYVVQDHFEDIVHGPVDTVRETGAL